mmetsp:Transcript_28463/g.44483  ORF Transcript_28463/g.44483 Transcript_28463/m.44483 type:complete len:117 (+) Transcript_28463:319-669(+)
MQVSSDAGQQQQSTDEGSFIVSECSDPEQVVQDQEDALSETELRLRTLSALVIPVADNCISNRQSRYLRLTIPCHSILKTYLERGHCKSSTMSDGLSPRLERAVLIWCFWSCQMPL